MSSSFGHHPAQPSPYPSQRPGPKAGVSTWIVGALVLLFLILGAVAGGFAGLLVMLALFLFGTGLYTLIFGRPSWLRLPSRKWGGIALGSGFVLLIVGGLLLPPSPNVEESSVAQPTPSVTSTVTPSATTSASPSATPSANPTPEPTSTPTPTPSETPTPASEPVTAESITSCAEAAARGIYNMPASSPAYSAKFDPDKDGIACENSEVEYDPTLLGGSPEVAAPTPSTPPIVPLPAPPAPEPAPPAPVPAPPVPEPAAPAPVAPYANCDAVRAAGAAPIYEGQPGWQSRLDGNDNDGIGCEN